MKMQLWKNRQMNRIARNQVSGLVHTEVLTKWKASGSMNLLINLNFIQRFFFSDTGCSANML